MAIMAKVSVLFLYFLVRFCIEICPVCESCHISGVYANFNFKEGDLVLKDSILFGIQHSSNKVPVFLEVK